MKPGSSEALKRMIEDQTVMEAVAELRAEYVTRATSRNIDEDARRLHLNMLWNLDNLISKMRANIEPTTKDQAE